MVVIMTVAANVGGRYVRGKVDKMAKFYQSTDFFKKKKLVEKY